MHLKAGALLRTISKNVFAVVIGCVMTMFILEAGARGFAGALGVTPYMQYHATFGWTARPNVSKRHKSAQGEFDVTYQLNEYGQRGVPYPHEKSRDVRRVVILGDSNGFGWGVPLGQTFGGIIDSSLACTEVINLALSGYGIDQSLLRFIEEGIAFHPDVVILQVTPNDFEEIQYSFFNQKPKPQFRLQEDGTLELSNVPVQAIGPKAQEFYDNSLPLPFQKWLDWNSYAFNALNGIYYQYRRKLSSQPAAQGKIFTPESIVLFNAIANELAAQLQAIGADGILVHTSGAIHAAGGVSATGLKVLDLHEHFESAAASVPERRYFSDGYHWNAVGHKVVAEELMKVVGSTGACGERLKAE